MEEKVTKPVWFKEDEELLEYCVGELQRVEEARNFKNGEDVIKAPRGVQVKTFESPDYKVMAQLSHLNSAFIGLCFWRDRLIEQAYLAGLDADKIRTCFADHTMSDLVEFREPNDGAWDLRILTNDQYRLRDLEGLLKGKLEKHEWFNILRARLEHLDILSSRVNKMREAVLEALHEQHNILPYLDRPLTRPRTQEEWEEEFQYEEEQQAGEVNEKE